MSNEQYFNDAGPGQKHSDMCHYSQAFVFGDVAKCAGQGGWDKTGKMDANDVAGQVELTFENVDRVLQAAGLRVWEDVYLIRTYHVNIGASFDLTIEIEIEIEVEVRKQSA
ncbi:uncharacterized protein J7T54_007562 [Emericellopsis cladophorae]|uniref:Uncharacterized protein n=1 Tax=Emericellopsis cladophorae TaxID=2686198 RepID=A0A9Q0BBA8_9HYPO|nr:uncharacterized protein J7T54_007562 [Emericellopsis cladophorae]KAI6779107.1 hypothetical protein J7T54_007562 [Emericellopsis cladophorae]